MATAAKTARTIITSQANAAGAGPVTGVWDLHTAFGGFLTVRVTNGGTGPTVAATVTVNVSNDNSTWRLLVAVTASSTNSAVNDFAFAIDPSVMYVQVSIGGNTAQAVTIEALGQEFTSFA